MSSLLIMAFLVSLLVNIFFIIFSNKKGIFIDDINKSHGSHKIPTPRIGGFGIYLSFGIFSLFVSETALLVWISTLPVFLTGLWEDLKGNISPKKRMVMMSFGVLLSIILLKTLVYDISITELPIIAAIPFTIFAVVGVTNAVNMVDGYNGLASGLILSSLFIMLLLIIDLKDYELATVISILISSILGFFILNFPFGKIFLGDSGAYTLGFIYGIISLLLLQRHEEISPWFPVVLLSYPITDVLFAILRRTFIQGTSPFSPDKLHFHSLIYKKVTKNNPLTSVFIILLSLPFGLVSLNFVSDDLYLFYVFISFASLYIVIYFLLVKKEELRMYKKKLDSRIENKQFQEML